MSQILFEIQPVVLLITHELFADLNLLNSQHETLLSYLEVVGLMAQKTEGVLVIPCQKLLLSLTCVLLYHLSLNKRFIIIPLISDLMYKTEAYSEPCRRGICKNG